MAETWRTVVDFALAKSGPPAAARCKGVWERRSRVRHADGCSFNRASMTCSGACALAAMWSAVRPVLFVRTPFSRAKFCFPRNFRSFLGGCANGSGAVAASTLGK